MASNGDHRFQDAACSAYPPGSERVTLAKGMLAVGGSCTVNGQPALQTNLTIRSLTILNDTWLQVMNR